MRLKELREQLGLQQKQVACELKISQRTYSNYELGKTEPDITTLVRLANYFNVSMDYLCCRDIPVKKYGNISTKIENLRKGKNLSQEQTAKIAEMSQSNYSKFERGILDISLPAALKLANYFGVTLDYLVNSNTGNIIELDKLQEDIKLNFMLIQKLSLKQNNLVTGYISRILEEEQSGI